MKRKCEHWDCGWCYYPTNCLYSECVGVKKCEHIKEMKQEAIKNSIIDEAEELSKHHPSKDCRFFAHQVYTYLKRK